MVRYAASKSSNATLWAQVFSLLCSAVIAVSALLKIRDRFTESNTTEKKRQLYKEAQKELATEVGHFTNARKIASVEGFSVSDKIGVQYPLLDVLSEAIKLRNFRKFRIFSRHFWRYWWQSRQTVSYTRKALAAVEDNDRKTAFEAMQQAAPIVESLYEKLTTDVKFQK